jgi:hypothetical protein
MENLSTAVIVVLIIWFSFFPVPYQVRYHVATNLILGLALLLLFIRKGAGIFKPRDFPLW